MEVFKRVHRGYDEPAGCPWAWSSLAWRGWRTSCLARLLQSHHGRALEAQISLEVLCNHTHQALERQLADQQLGRLLVATDLTKFHSSRPVTMWLHSVGRWSTLARSLRRQLLPRRLSTGRLASFVRTSFSSPDKYSHNKYRKTLETCARRLSNYLCLSDSCESWRASPDWSVSLCSDWCVSIRI